jgi:hypothetical protein
MGCPDEEFENNLPKRRIGYVGDSVAYGIGAGYGYRILDILQEKFPQYHHWVCIGDSLSDINVKLLDKLQLDSVVYLMNLNDILPAQTSDHEDQRSSWLREAKMSVLGRMDTALRGESYVYTYARLRIKNMLQRLGYEAHGFPAFELFPSRNREVIESTIERIATTLKNVWRMRHNQACIVVLPYEMQVSRGAAERYKELGFEWEKDFESGLTQKIILEGFERHQINAFDARKAFEGRELGIGEAFVFNQGDKIDWNHPNRLGHAIIASWLFSSSEFVSKCINPGS